MKDLKSKILDKIPRGSTAFNSIVVPLSFSPAYVLVGLPLRVFKTLRMPRLKAIAEKANEKWIQKYLKELFEDLFSKYREDGDCGQPVDKAPIWMLWWTGEEDAPQLVKRCMESVKKNAAGHPVHILTQENYTQYVKVPDIIMEKVQSGNIRLAHLADYIRVKLLAEHGGLWLDATIYISQQIPEEIFAFPMFTFKGPVMESEFVSNYRWSTFGLGGWKGNVFYRVIAEALEHYWTKNDYAITYLFFDSIINSAYENLPELKRLIDALPENHIHRNDLQKAMEEGLPAEKLDSVINEDTGFYKLNWKATFPEESPDGKPTIYKKLFAD